MTSKRRPLFSSLLLFSLLAPVRSPSQLGHRRAPPTAVAKSIDTQLFQPAIGSHNFITVDGADVPDHKQLSFGLSLNYQWRPSRIYTKGTGARPTSSTTRRPPS